VVVPLPAVLDEKKSRQKRPVSQPDSEKGKDHRGLSGPIGRRRKAGDDLGSAIRSERREASKTASSAEEKKTT
jgi:hypothetical protein